MSRKKEKIVFKIGSSIANNRQLEVLKNDDTKDSEKKERKVFYSTRTDPAISFAQKVAGGMSRKHPSKTFSTYTSPEGVTYVSEKELKRRKKAAIYEERLRTARTPGISQKVQSDNSDKVQCDNSDKDRLNKTSHDKEVSRNDTPENNDDTPDSKISLSTEDAPPQNSQLQRSSDEDSQHKIPEGSDVPSDPDISYENPEIPPLAFMKKIQKMAIDNSSDEDTQSMHSASTATSATAKPHDRFGGIRLPVRKLFFNPKQIEYANPKKRSTGKICDKPKNCSDISRFRTFISCFFFQLEIY